MRCSRCGAEMPDGSGFCGACGNHLRAADEASPADSGIPPAIAGAEAWTIGGALGAGWRTFNRMPGASVGATLVWLFAWAVAAFIPFAGLVAGGPLMVGLAAFGLSGARGGHPGPEEVFAGFSSRFWPSLVANLLTSILVVVGLVLLIVPGLILSMMFSMTFQILVDRGGGGWEAMKASREMTRGHRMDLFLFGLAIGAVNLLGLLLCGLGLLVTIPVSIFAFAHVYDSLKR